MNKNRNLYRYDMDSYRELGVDIKPVVNKFQKKLEELESRKPETFLDNNLYIDDLDDVTEYWQFLYHGIRFQDHLEKLESIFKDRAILAGNYQNNNYYYSYSDNCNEGEYVSLMYVESSSLEYQTFIVPNITLVISPECNAIKTIYLPFEEWSQVKDLETINRYSYAKGEYHVKKMIPIEMVKAIGIPADYLRSINEEELIDIYQNDILALMEKYDLDLPLVDTSYYNSPLIMSKNCTLKRKK